MRHALAALAFLFAIVPALAQQTPPDAAPAAAPATAPVVRTTLDPKEGAVIGQHVSLYVDVLFPGDMPRPPRVAIPDMPGAQVMRFETQGTTIRDTVDGAAYVGQRFEFAVFPRRSGPLEIPPATVTLLDRAGGVTGTIAGQSVQETIVAPEGIDANSLVVATEKLTLEQSWMPDPAGTFHPGDALVRTITRTATDIPALAMRDLAFPAPDGVRVYVDAPVSQDQSERGTITGRRVDKVTYVFEKAGSFALPAVAQPWWNLADKQAESATSAATTVTVQAGPAPAATPGAASKPVRPAVWVSLAAIAILAALALAMLWRKGRAHTARRRAEWAVSEPAAFKALTRACGSGDVAAIYAALATWRSRLPAAWPPPPDASVLEAALFADKSAKRPAWSRAMAHELLSKLRLYRRAALATPAERAAPPLPPLNPANTGLSQPANASIRI
ncbi:hypothetical protein K32_12820 [Kaistia sp. 32K]|uniref:BatD family protein n=1 Tax=Kaistia sp. 32K TaxID=2795690 RepID=UPI001915166A|nr:BatD family protein [Kaistia sp. 32K]BCP52665.1 hypothetical protein K32_12820 [Kaistia sp. 32K]